MLPFSVHITLTFVTKHALKFKYLSCCLKVEATNTSWLWSMYFCELITVLFILALKVQGKSDHQMFVTNNWYIPVKNALGWSSAAYCGARWCSYCLLCSVSLDMPKNLTSGLLQTERLTNNGTVIESDIFDRIHMYSVLLRSKLLSWINNSTWNMYCINLLLSKHNKVLANS